MNLDLFRKEIEEIDLQIIRLLNKRMRNSLIISRLKDKIKDKDREKYIFNYLDKSPSLLLDKKFKRGIFENIIRESCVLQQKGQNTLIVLEQDFYGISKKEIIKKVNKPITFFTCESIQFIVELLKNSLVDYSLISKGQLKFFQDLFATNKNIKIIDEFKFTPRYCLMGKSSLDEINEVYVNANSLKYCSKFIGLNNFMIKEYGNIENNLTKMFKSFTKNTGLIANMDLACLYGLDIIKRDLANDFAEIDLCLIGKECDI